MYSKSGKADLEYLRDTYALTRKPVLITEFSWRATQNSFGRSEYRRRGRHRGHTSGTRRTLPPPSSAKSPMSPYIMGTHWFSISINRRRPLDRWRGLELRIVDIHDKP